MDGHMSKINAIVAAGDCMMDWGLSQNLCSDWLNVMYLATVSFCPHWDLNSELLARPGVLPVKTIRSQIVAKHI